MERRWSSEFELCLYQPRWRLLKQPAGCRKQPPNLLAHRSPTIDSTVIELPWARPPLVGGRAFFFQSCAHCHGQDADGGEDAPSLLKLQISGAHMALVIQNGIKDEMPSFAKKYNEHETTAIVAYLKTLH